MAGSSDFFGIRLLWEKTSKGPPLEVVYIRSILNRPCRHSGPIHIGRQCVSSYISRNCLLVQQSRFLCSCMPGRVRLSKFSMTSCSCSPVYMGNFANFYYDMYTCSKTIAWYTFSSSVWVNKENLAK